MIWQYFPIGFRFPVRDFSEETKRACWETALSALYASDPKDVTLYDAQETYDVGSGGPVYICIACFYGIKQARSSAKVLMSRDRLMSRLCSHQPIIQANALESFGPYPLLGKVEQDGTIGATEAGLPLFAGIRPNPMQGNNGIRLLIVSDAGKNAQDAEACTRLLGTAASDQGYQVRRMLIADGKNGLIRALVTERKGRFETVSVHNANGDRLMDIIGILPNETAVMETTGKDTAIIGALIQRIADFGYRKILIGADADADKEHVQNSLQPFGGLGATVLSDAESVLHAIDFETAAKQADFVILHAFDADGDAAKTTLSELKTLQKPTCLLTRKAIDAKRMMRENAVLRGVIELDEAQPLQKQSFDDKVLPLIGKDVAKAQQV